MDKKNFAIILVLLTTILTSSAQFLYKFGIDRLQFNLISIITNWNILLGLLLYAFGAVIMITAFKYGEVSALYPIIATSYIWVSIGSSILFNESMNIWKWLGVLIICIGVIFISLGSKSKESLAYNEVV